MGLISRVSSRTYRQCLPRLLTTRSHRRLRRQQRVKKSKMYLKIKVDTLGIQLHNMSVQHCHKDGNDLLGSISRGRCRLEGSTKPLHTSSKANATQTNINSHVLFQK